MGLAGPGLLELVGVMNLERYRVLGEFPFHVGLLLAAILLVGILVLLVMIAVCLARRAIKPAGLLASWLAAAIVFNGAVYSWKPSGPRGLAAWTRSVNTGPINAWLAGSPTGLAPPSSSWVLYYAGEKSALHRAALIPVTTVPRFDTGKLPEEVFVLPGNGAMIAVYRVNMTAYFVAIGPTAASVPAEFDAPVTWTTVGPDFLVGELTRG